ncbi:MAG: polyribonucleotide nucleotidyltransferase, partial [Candidatus Roizmanbacteria bacterium]
EIISKAISLAKAENNKIIEFIEMLHKKVGQEKIEVHEPETRKEIVAIIEKDHMEEIEKMTRERATKERSSHDDYKNLIDAIKKEHEDKKYGGGTIADAIEYASNKFVRTVVLDQNSRIDGRGFEDVRELFIEAGVLPRTHGSAIFQRGLTQVLSVATLGSLGMELFIEGPEGQESKRYMHYYNAPPFCYGEPGRIGSPGRREIGHGALAEKAIEPVLPSEEEFPYVAIVQSEILSSNGSTSMAATCGSTLALLDAGVPLKNPVAGISVGLMERSAQEYKLLVDIIGMEDFAGDMDFKVAGTKDGITAIQLDVKNSGLTDNMITETLELARKTRLFLLDKMAAVIPAPKALSQYAPKVVILTPPEDKIGAIIGPGGKNIRHITALTGAEINVGDDGKVSISGIKQESVDQAAAYVEGLYTEAEKGKEYEGTVKTILPFGAVVEFLPGREGLVHISKMGTGFIKNVTDVVQIGDMVTVKVEEVDPRGRTSLILVPKA